MRHLMAGEALHPPVAGMGGEQGLQQIHHLAHEVRVQELASADVDRQAQASQARVVAPDEFLHNQNAACFERMIGVGKHAELLLVTVT